MELACADDLFGGALSYQILPDQFFNLSVVLIGNLEIPRRVYALMQRLCVFLPVYAHNYAVLKKQITDKLKFGQDRG